MQNLYKDLEKLLLSVDELKSEDGKILKNKVTEMAVADNTLLLSTLLKNAKLKKHFFNEIEKGVVSFKKDTFIQFINNKEFLPNSFTAFANKIGLHDGESYMTTSQKVSLAWPYKDCVLEGGQDKEDQKRSEVFYNETLAADEIDRLLDKKVLTNFKKYSKKGSETPKDISDSDNLIIKGNNLLALHSLREKYAGEVKLIYIDPPYNTGSDSFGYNDRFNHSSWLTFMKNRLIVARDLLSETGVIFVHCDDNEQAYLKVMMDELYGNENYIETITVVNNPRGRDYGGVANMHELITIYSKTPNYELYPLTDPDKEFPYTDKVSGFELRELRNRNTKFNDKNRPNLVYPFYLNPNNQDGNGLLEISLEKQKGWVEVFPAKSQGIQTVWRWGKPKSLENLNINICGKAMKEKGRYQIVEKYRENTRLARSVWWDKEVNSERGTLHLRKLFGEKVFNYPKPEETLKRVIEMSTLEGDLVLDYHLGSGTTAATAHKMNRRYIGVEQMDYIEDVAVSRLLKVIKNEQGGISNSVNWKGGGSFVYAELKKHNQSFVDDIDGADTSKKLQAIYKKMQSEAFFRYEVDLSKFDIKEFSKLEVAEQKQVLLECLDKNHLYVNHSEINDTTYKVSAEDKKLNTLFYRK